MKNLMTLAFLLFFTVAGLQAQSQAAYTPTYKMSLGHQLRDLQNLLDLSKAQMQVLKDYYTTTASALRVELEDASTDAERAELTARYQGMRDEKVRETLDADQVAGFEQYLYDRVHRQQEEAESPVPATPGLGGGK